MPKTTEFPDLTRRAVILGAVGASGISLLAGRLYYLQFMRAERYRSLAEGNRVKLEIIAPIRGTILDRNGKALAENTNVFRLFIDLERYPKPLEIIEKLQQWVHFSESEIEAAKALQAKRRYGMVFLVKDRVPWDEVVKIEHHIIDLPGVQIEQGQQRLYPLAQQAAHCIGYVGAVNEAEKKEFYRWPQAKLGRQGLEDALEPALRGEPGLRQIEVNARGLSLQKLEENPALRGKDMHITLNRDLQAFTYSRLLQEQSGAAVVMQADSGDVLALASAPSFDSTVMSQGINAQDWNALRESNRTPLMDKSIAGQYPPGSTFKMITALAGLEARLTTPQKRLYCPGHFYLGRKRFNCWRVGGHGHMNLTDALEQSCDTYFYKLAEQMGMENIAQMSRRFGLGQLTGLDIPGEKSGLIPDRDWKYRSYQQSWQGGVTINASIGQGYVLTTPLQLARMTAALVNGGKLVRPRLMQPALSQPIAIEPEWLEVVRRGMAGVVNNPRGTARGSRIDDPAFLMAGKTGTAQVRRITIRGQDQSEVPWHHRHHALFVGYAPAEEPRYVVAVVVEHGGGGSRVAAPIARDLLLKTQQYVDRV